jgi:LPS-assembly protein
MRLTPLALAAGLLFIGGTTWAQAPDPLQLEPSRKLNPPPRGDAASRLPIILRAEELRARPDLEAVADGNVEFRRGGITISADRLSYEQAEDLASARGNVRVARDGAIYRGPELQLRVQRFEGYFLSPEFEFTQIGAGGRADRIDFLDSSRARATNAIYTSCPRDGSGGPPDWVLETTRVKLDFDTNEGVAEGAVLRFLGTPILALPALSFPLTDERKSGWLPPTVVPLDSRSGTTVSMPYYWNIAPNRDATITPRILLRRGFGADGEFRSLAPRDEGTLGLQLLPDDHVAQRSRGALQWRHEGGLAQGLRYSADITRVSDAGWWKDFPDAGRSITPRLLSLRGAAEQPFELAGGEGLLYARAQHWQLLQGSDALVTSPYQRSPQLGLHLGGKAPMGLELAFESEVNRFTLPDGDTDPNRLTGTRWHAVGSAALPWRDPAAWFVPKLSFNAAAYRTDLAMADGRSSARRLIPTFSIDTGVELERQGEAFGRSLRQTLEPRLLYVNTPYKAQAGLPNFDAAAKDFNFNSIYAENAFSGIDRVSDAHQLTAGVTSRLVDADSGAEAMRLGLVQRFLFRDQLVTANADGTPDGAPLQQRFSDLLLLASTNLVPKWTLDASVQYSPDISRPVRSILGARFSPGPFRTVSATYRLARGLSEQVEMGWQWPLTAGATATPASLAAASGIGASAARHGSSGCGGTWYTVGRFNYSLKDSRITDAIVGAEYDAGCWIGRVVAERLSTGRSEATTRLLLQLELVGLSRIGSNPLKVLKDNIPGYRLLREDRRASTLSDE